MILTHTIGRYTLRQDPVLIARLVQMKRSEMGEFSQALNERIYAAMISASKTGEEK